MRTSLKTIILRDLQRKLRDDIEHDIHRFTQLCDAADVPVNKAAPALITALFDITAQVIVQSVNAERYSEVGEKLQDVIAAYSNRHEAREA